MQKRIDSLELLKIISILMVIGLHYLNINMGGMLSESNNIYGLITHILESACICACNIFILISGYFLIEKEKKKCQK